MDLSIFSALLPGRWPAWTHGPWVLSIAGAVALLLLLWLWRALRRRARRQPAGYDIRFDLFARTPPINSEQVGLLHYLQEAFAEEVVLYRPRLSHFLTPRKSRQHRAALLRLVEEQVDFLICDKSGKPKYAFDVDPPKATHDALLKRAQAEKNLILKTAGVRLVRLKGAYTHWPPPEVLRQRMMSERKTAPSAQGPASGFAPSEFANPKFAQSTFGDSRYMPPSPSSTMGLSTLMGVPQDESNPWATTRKR
jgi:hypothetical protein